MIEFLTKDGDIIVTALSGISHLYWSTRVANTRGVILKNDTMYEVTEDTWHGLKALLFAKEGGYEL